MIEEKWLAEQRTRRRLLGPKPKKVDAEPSKHFRFISKSMVPYLVSRVPKCGPLDCIGYIRGIKGSSCQGP